VSKRRFQAQPTTIAHDLRRIVTQMGATSLHVSQDLFDGAAEIVFDREGRRYVFTCRKYGDANDNLRAAQLSITYLWRALNEYGVAMSDGAVPADLFEQFFLGFAATPDAAALQLTAGDSCWAVLGVRREDATAEAVRNAYRALALVHHPDRGGKAEDFRRLRGAYEQALDELGEAAPQDALRGKP
jgi:hypothetical protein